MKHGIWPLVGAASMRALDRHSIDVLGVPGELLMENPQDWLKARQAAAEAGVK